VLTCSTEDEANACAGVWMAASRLLMIQHAGLYASINTLRGVHGRARAIFYMIGC